MANNMIASPLGLFDRESFYGVVGLFMKDVLRKSHIAANQDFIRWI